MMPVRMMDDARMIKLLIPSRIRGMRPFQKPVLVSMAPALISTVEIGGRLLEMKRDRRNDGRKQAVEHLIPSIYACQPARTDPKS
jgi:hypothetical protein